MSNKKKVLVAPLNWGLGHATRCIPIINALINNNFEPVIASDGAALALLKKEFPNLSHLKLPSYNISYSKYKFRLKLALLLNTPRILKAIKSEKNLVSKIIGEYEIAGIISDNRFGVYHETVPSVYITHQLNVLSGNTTRLSSKIHQRIIKNFDECWIPDYDDEPNYSGRLGHLKHYDVPIKYLGILSRFNKESRSLKYDLAIALSGPEPQRTLLENLLLQQLKDYDKKVILIRGKIENQQTKSSIGSLTIYNFMTSKDLENTLNESAIVLSRSGYTTIMDLAKLNKKAFFIPTPGQDEQEYLAKRYHENGWIPCCEQSKFTLDKLKLVEQYSGFIAREKQVNFKALFSLFESK